MAVRLLVVDDSLTIRRLIEMSLRDGDYALDFASTGAEGIEKAGHGIDVLLLDYILPDMKGFEVAQRLAESRHTAQVPIVVMTAKSADVKPQFAAYPSVVDFITKPFTPADIVSRIGKAARAGESRPAESAPLAHKEAAQVIYTRLRPSLARIPEWAREMGDAPAAAYFAKRIITPPVVQDILSALMPFVAAVPSAPPASMQLVGRLSTMAFKQLVGTVERLAHTGELRFTLGEREYTVFFDKGAIVMATTNDPDHYLEGAGFDVGAVPYESYARAAAEQRGGGKPVFLTLAEGGHVPAGEVSDLLEVQTRRLIAELAAAVEGRFALPEEASLPTWVHAHGRPINLMATELARLRSVDDAAGEPLALETVLDRAAGFSRRVDTLGLTADEIRLLAGVDGRASVASLISQTGLPADAARRSLRALREVGLLGERHGGERRSPGPVLLWERDPNGLAVLLERLLRNRTPPLRVRRVGELAEVLEALGHERSPLCIVNLVDAGGDAMALAQSVRRLPQRPPLLALQEVPHGGAARALIGAGYDRVSTKPIHLHEIELLLATDVEPPN